MCLLCDDEKAYQAYMNYLDAMERQGKTADPDKAVELRLRESNGDVALVFAQDVDAVVGAVPKMRKNTRPVVNAHKY